MLLSPAAAARIAGVSRSLVSKEIKAGRLLASVKNNGHQSISEADLKDWMERRIQRDNVPEDEAPAPQAPAQVPTQVEALTQALADTRATVARMEGQAEGMTARLADLAADRDAWRAQAERLSARPVSIWSRILGR